MNLSGSVKLASDEDLALRWQVGDDDAARELTARFWKNAYHEAKAAEIPMTDVEDRHAINLIALHKAAMSYKPGKGSKFISYALTIMRREMASLARKQSRKSRAGESSAIRLDHTEVDVGKEDQHFSALEDAERELERLRTFWSSKLLNVFAGDESQETHLMRDALLCFVKLSRRSHELSAGHASRALKILKRRSGQMLLYPTEEVLPMGEFADALRSLFGSFLTLIVVVCEDLSEGTSAARSRKRHGVDKPTMAALLALARSEFTVAA